MTVARIRVERDVGDKAELRESFLIARQALQTRLLSLKASLPRSSLRCGSVYGKNAIAGRPSLTARSASRTASSMLSRSTPGIAATGTRRFSPSMRNSGQIRSFVVSTCSCDQSPRPFGLAVAARAVGEVEAVGLGNAGWLVHGAGFLVEVAYTPTGARATRRLFVFRSLNPSRANPPDEGSVAETLAASFSIGRPHHQRLRASPSLQPGAHATTKMPPPASGFDAPKAHRPFGWAGNSIRAAAPFRRSSCSARKTLL